MSIRRTVTPADHFTIVPNDWLRDESLSWKARGLLAYLMSHRVGWTTSVGTLVRVGTDGKAAVLTGLRELEDAGYLIRTQSRTIEGQFGEVDFDLIDPVAPLADYPSTGNRRTDNPPAGNQTPKKINSSEDQDPEDQEDLLISSGELIALEEVATPGFEAFWSVWPRKVGKRKAEAEWPRAVARAGGAVTIVAAALAYRDNPHRPETQFTPHPTTWLNRDGWDDELPGPRTNGKVLPMDRMKQSLAAMGLAPEGRKELTS